MANLQEEINKLRNATYGEEVRSSLISSIEAVNGESTNANTVAKDVNSRQAVLEKKFNEQIKNITLTNPSSAEIVAMRTSPDGSSYKTAGERLDNVERNVSSITIKYDSTITDYSQVLIAAMSNAEGKTFVFEPGKVYPFTTQIDINGMKNCTIDFRNAILKDMGRMMDVVLVTQDDVTGTYYTTPKGQELNPLGVRFTNFENLTIKNLILDSVDMPVSPNNYRIKHDDVTKKRANICFATGRNLEFINSEFRCGQGTYIQGAYVQGDATRLPNQLEFFMSKIYNVNNVIFKNILYNGKSKTEVFGFGKCKHVLFEGIEKQSNTLVSFFKMLQCEDVKINGFNYDNLQNFSLTDISGTNYNIENLNVNYESGKAFDITNEWGLSGGTLGDFRIKNCNIDADTILHCSLVSYQKLFKNVEIQTINSVTIENCVLGHKGTRTGVDGENIAVSNNSGNIINLNVYNTTIYNLHISNQNLRYDKQLVPHTVTIDRLHYIVDNEFYKLVTGCGDMAGFNVFGKTLVTNSVFDMNNIRLSIKDGMISGSADAPSAPKNLTTSTTYAVFKDCTFNDTEINLAAKCEFINCTFSNVRIKNNGSWDGCKVKFNNCKFNFKNDTKSYSGNATNSCPFYFIRSELVEFVDCKFEGAIKSTTNNIFLSNSYAVACKYVLKNCKFDLWVENSSVKSSVYLFQITNKASTDTYSLELLIDGCEFLNYTIPLKLTGNSSAVESTRILDITIKNCISKQNVQNYSVLVDSSRIHYELTNLTLKNNEMTKYRQDVSNDGISIPSNAVFKRLVKEGNTGIVV